MFWFLCKFVLILGRLTEVYCCCYCIFNHDAFISFNNASISFNHGIVCWCALYNNGILHDTIPTQSMRGRVLYQSLPRQLLVVLLLHREHLRQTCLFFLGPRQHRPLRAQHLCVSRGTLVSRKLGKRHVYGLGRTNIFE